MTELATKALTGKTETRRVELTVVALALLASTLAISNQSYWIDELAAAYKATLPTLADWWRVISEGGSDLQQPLYPLFVWLLPRTISLNEVALRATNILWLVIGLVVFTKATNGSSAFRTGFIAVVLLSPFAWYYLNEARPYTLQLSASLVVFSAVYRLGNINLTLTEERRWLVLLCGTAVVLAASGMLAMMWLGAYLTAAILSSSVGRMVKLAKTHWGLCCLTLVLFSALGIYYLWTLSIGARATAVGATDFRNVLFIPFELLGFSGMGPGRGEIRNEGLRAFKPWLPLLLVYGAVVLVVVLAGLKRLVRLFSRKTLVCWAGLFTGVAVVLLLVGLKVHFRVLGRHFTPMFPLVALLLGTGLSALNQQKHLLAKLGVVCFVGLAFVSCGFLRFSPRHAKDDYRGAARLARQALAEGETVWWNAYDWGAFVYHVPVAAIPGTPHKAVLVVNEGKGFGEKLAAPDVVIASKPDIYDAFGGLEDYLSRHGYKQVSALPAFSLWRPGRTP